MLSSNQIAGALLAATILTAGSAAAQSQGQPNSPYSRMGLGDYAGNLGGVRQLGMGGVGIAAPNTGNVNELNPALLTYTSRTTWEAGFNAEIKTLRSATAFHRTGSGTLGYLAMAVPLSRRWAAAIGLKPYSTVSYNTVTTGNVNGDANSVVQKQYQGTGGLTEAYIGTGIHVLRDLNIGGSASYLFGTIDQSIGTAILTSSQQLVVLNEHQRYSDFLFRAAAHYRHKLTKDLNLNVGGVYSFATNLSGSRTTTEEQRDANGAILERTTGPNTTVPEVVQLSDVSGHAYVPGQVQVGVALDNSRNWSVGVDGSYQRWSQFTSFSELSNASLSDTWRVAAGGELTPDPSSVDQYFKRVTYRVGLSTAQLPYAPKGQTLYDRAISWGFGFPLPTGTPLETTTLSLGFTYGLRGNTNYVQGNIADSNVRESYLRVQVAATLGNRWFIKRRLQ